VHVHNIYLPIYVRVYAREKRDIVAARGVVFIRNYLGTVYIIILYYII